MKRVIFYFDGFNFYNGLKDKSFKDNLWRSYYWIDLVKFCEQFYTEGDSEVSVKYYTARPNNREKASKQAAFLNANKLINNSRFKVTYGQYINKTIDCRAVCKEPFTTLEEKRTDVNIALNMLLDCVNDQVDTLVLVSADSDQVPTLEVIKSKYPNKKVKAYFPPMRNSYELTSLCKPVVFLELHEEKFKRAIMPNELEKEGKKYTKPQTWKTL
jgi:uncharacterized LabA/DUF88 family protein